MKYGSKVGDWRGTEAGWCHEFRRRRARVRRRRHQLVTKSASRGRETGGSSESGGRGGGLQFGRPFRRRRLLISIFLNLRDCFKINIMIIGLGRFRTSWCGCKAWCASPWCRGPCRSGAEPLCSCTRAAARCWCLIGKYTCRGLQGQLVEREHVSARSQNPLSRALSDLKAAHRQFRHA